jgi:cell cycle checkpoint protein
MLRCDPVLLSLLVSTSDSRRSIFFSQVLYKDAPVDTSLFNLYLHQNYPVFCTDIDECAESIDALSRSDSLKTDDDMVSPSHTCDRLHEILRPFQSS